MARSWLLCNGVGYVVGGRRSSLVLALEAAACPSFMQDKSHVSSQQITCPSFPRRSPGHQPCHHLFCPLYARSDRYYILACRTAVDCPHFPRAVFPCPHSAHSFPTALLNRTRPPPGRQNLASLTLRPHAPLSNSLLLTVHYVQQYKAAISAHCAQRLDSQQTSRGALLRNVARDAGCQDVRWHDWVAVNMDSCSST